MEKQSGFCTCTNLDCPLHPTRHENGCTPCIRKNLKRKEIPSCFFQLVEGSERRRGDTFADFAKLLAGTDPSD